VLYTFWAKSSQSALYSFLAVIRPAQGWCFSPAVGAQTVNMAFAFPGRAGQSCFSLHKAVKTPAFLGLFGVDRFGPIP
jgi:hypothetical protein